MKKLLGYLMFLANSGSKNEHWYNLKQKLCDRFGVNNGYDIQYIEGKKCHSCNGTGIYTNWSERLFKEECWNCHQGWYKRPLFVLLERIKVGDKVFHKPIRREYRLDDISALDIPPAITIYGYVNHTSRKYGWMAFSILYILFDLKGYRMYVKGMGVGWRCSWWLPKNYLYNFMHLKRNGWKAIPLSNMRRKIKAFKFLKRQPEPINDDMPF